MKLNKYFFKKHWHTFRRELSDALRSGKKTTFEFLGRLSWTKDMHFWSRENTLLKDSKYFLNNLYTRLVVRGEYRTRDLIILFIIAFFVGVAFKTAATKAITIGFEDYTLPPKETLLNLNTVQKKMTENGDAFIDDSNIQGGVCSE